MDVLTQFALDAIPSKEGRYRTIHFNVQDRKVFACDGFVLAVLNIPSLAEGEESGYLTPEQFRVVRAKQPPVAITFTNGLAKVASRSDTTEFVTPSPEETPLLSLSLFRDLLASYEKKPTVTLNPRLLGKVLKCLPKDVVALDFYILSDRRHEAIKIVPRGWGGEEEDAFFLLMPMSKG